MYTCQMNRCMQFWIIDAPWGDIYGDILAHCLKAQAHTKTPKVKKNILEVMILGKARLLLVFLLFVCLFCTSKICLCPLKVFLLPLVLARKRVWNPKYPICIQLAAGSELQDGERGGLVENLEDELGAEPPPTCSKESNNPPSTLYLFGRTGREKEEWFHHLLLASMDEEVELEKDRQRHGRCVSRLGMRNILNALN